MHISPFSICSFFLAVAPLAPQCGSPGRADTAAAGRSYPYFTFWWRLGFPWAVSLDGRSNDFSFTGWELVARYIWIVG